MTQEQWTQEETDMHQAHDYMIINYVHKITRKWEEKQGMKFKSLDDFCEEGRKEIDDWYRSFPRDHKTIQDLIKKRNKARENNGR